MIQPATKQHNTACNKTTQYSLQQNNTIQPVKKHHNTACKNNKLHPVTKQQIHPVTKQQITACNKTTNYSLKKQQRLSCN